jgi:hypothetical protein
MPGRRLFAIETTVAACIARAVRHCYFRLALAEKLLFSYTTNYRTAILGYNCDTSRPSHLLFIFIFKTTLYSEIYIA